MHPSKHLYGLLGLTRRASRDDIRKAHRRLVRQYHPDANPDDPRAEERFKEVQRAYEVLSDEGKRREYDERLRASSSPGGSPGRPRARGVDARAGRRTTSSEDLSDALRKLANLSGDGRSEGNFRLQGEDIARVARQLGIDVSRLSSLLDENIKVNARVSFGDTRSRRSPATDENASAGKPPGTSDEPQEKKAKGPKAQREEKRVKGPNARRADKSD